MPTGLSGRLGQMRRAVALLVALWFLAGMMFVGGLIVPFPGVVQWVWFIRSLPVADRPETGPCLRGTPPFLGREPKGCGANASEHNQDVTRVNRERSLFCGGQRTRAEQPL